MKPHRNIAVAAVHFAVVAVLAVGCGTDATTATTTPETVTSGGEPTNSASWAEQVNALCGDLSVQAGTHTGDDLEQFAARLNELNNTVPDNTTARRFIELYQQAAADINHTAAAPGVYAHEGTLDVLEQHRAELDELTAALGLDNCAPVGDALYIEPATLVCTELAGQYASVFEGGDAQALLLWLEQTNSELPDPDTAPAEVFHENLASLEMNTREYVNLATSDALTRMRSDLNVIIEAGADLGAHSCRPSN